MPSFEDDLAKYHAAQEELSAEEEHELRLFIRQEFYNTCHSPDGTFCEGSDGPGRLKENIAKAEKTLGKKAPMWAKNLLSRRLGKARTKAEKLLPKTSADYQKAIIKRRAEAKVIKGE